MQLNVAEPQLPHYEGSLLRSKIVLVHAADDIVTGNPVDLPDKPDVHDHVNEQIRHDSESQWSFSKNSVNSNSNTENSEDDQERAKTDCCLGVTAVVANHSEHHRKSRPQGEEHSGLRRRLNNDTNAAKNGQDAEEDNASLSRNRLM